MPEENLFIGTWEDSLVDNDGDLNIWQFVFTENEVKYISNSFVYNTTYMGTTKEPFNSTDIWTYEYTNSIITMRMQSNDTNGSSTEGEADLLGSSRFEPRALASPFSSFNTDNLYARLSGISQ